MRANAVLLHLATDAALQAELERRARVAWKIVLVAYLVPVTVATHWPRLGFGDAGMIDKFVHFIAFGMLGWIAMHAAPLGRPLVGFAFAAAWVYIDERTQAIEILGRVFSAYDMAAGWLGVLMAGALFAARRFRPPVASRVVVDARMYGDGRNWLLAAAICVVMVLVVGGAMYAWATTHGMHAGLAAAIYPIGFSGFIGVACATVLLERLTIVEYRRTTQLSMQLSGHRVGQFSPRIPASAALTAIIVAIAVTAALMFAFAGFTRACFGATIPDELTVDHAGFVVLREGFFVASILVSLACARTVTASMPAARA